MIDYAVMGLATAGRPRVSQACCHKAALSPSDELALVECHKWLGVLEA